MHYKNILTFLTFLFFLAFTHDACGYNLRQISNIDGLSNSAVLSLYQDHDGFLWLGTCDGLNLYDGLEFHPLIFAEGKSLSGNIIENILETENGTLWVQTNYGLDKLDKYKKKIKSYTQFQGGYLLRKNPKNEVFVLSENNSLHYITATSDNFHRLHIPEVKREDIVDIHVGTDTIWLFTKQGILKYGLTTIQDTYAINHSEKIDSIPLQYCFTDEDVAYLIDSQNRLYEYQIEHNSKKLVTDLTHTAATRGIISDLIKDKESFFISFKTSGVIKLTRQKEGYAAEDLGIKSGIFQLLKDRNQDIVWIGTDGQGTYLYSNGQYSIQSITYSDLQFHIAKPIRSIFLDQEQSLWLGTKGEGILKINNFKVGSHLQNCQKELITSTNSLLWDNSVYAFAPSSRPLFWIGNDEGINYYSYREKRIKRIVCEEPIKYVHGIYEEHDSILWISTVGTGIIRATITGTPTDPKLTHMQRYTIDHGNFSSNYFFTMYADEQGELYFGNRGYGTFQLKDGTLKPVPLINNYKKKTANDVYAILKDNHTLWLGTSYGLIKQSEGKEWCFNKENGLQNSTIHTMLKDNSGNIWMGTNGGLERFHTEHHEIQNYNRMNGMSIVEFCDGAALKTKEALIFGGINGLAVIRENPSYRTANHYRPPLRFTRLNILGKEQNLYDFIQYTNHASKIVLEHNQNYFTIAFIAMDYINSNNYSYLYKIEPKGNEWIDNGLSNSVSFTQMSPGDYTLYVKYKDRTSGEESEIYSMNIHIQAPWYLSNTAMMAYQVLFFTFIVMLIRLYVIRQQRKQKQMVLALEQAHKEEVYEEKLRFFTNITHEFCTPLTLIYGPCERILNYGNADSFIRKYILLIKQNAERLNVLIQEVIDFRRIETGHKTRKIQQVPVSKICCDILDSFAELAEQNKVELENLIEPNLVWNSDTSCLTKIINNLISNAFKYTPNGGTVRITLKIVKNHLHLSVYNTGKGIKEEDRASIFNRYSILDNVEENAVKGLSSRNGLGMAICHSMVELLEGQIEIKSEVNRYAEFMVTFPELPAQESTEEEEHVIQTPSSPEADPLTDIALHIATPKPGRTEQLKGQILIIDDNQEILDLLQESLSDYQTVTALNAEEGLNLLKTTYPDLIISDIMMPGTDGIELTRQIKQNKHTMHIPLIIISAKNSNEEKIKGLESGADAYIGKPFNLNYLRANVERLIENYSKIKEYYNSSACAYEFSNGQLMKKEDKEFMQSVTEFINNNLENTELKPEDLAEHLQISIRSLYRKFKEMEQLPPKDLIKDCRINLAAKLLKTTTLTVQEIIYQCGFGNRSHFYKEFDKRFQMTPKEFRQQHKLKDESLTY